MYRIRAFHRVQQGIVLVVVLVALLAVTTPVGATPAPDGEKGVGMDVNGFVWTPDLTPLSGATSAPDGEKGVGMDVNGARMRVR